MIREYPDVYIEFELNCNGALFVSRITNECNDCSCIKGDELQCNDMIAYGASVTFNKQINHFEWNAYVIVSLDFIINNTMSNNNNNNGYNNVTELQANFYRIDVLTDHNNIYQYSSWRPTNTSPPCFHVPSSFATFSLV